MEKIDARNSVLTLNRKSLIKSFDFVSRVECSKRSMPSHSLKWNPIEYLNCDLKAGFHSGPSVKTLDQLKDRALLNLRRIQKMPIRIVKYFKHPKIAYTAYSCI